MEKELRPWDIWVQNNPQPTAQPVTLQTNDEIEAHAEHLRQPVEVRPWDLLNPNKARASEQTEKERLEICKNCPSYRKFAKQCKECGCIMPAKVKLADAFCPLGKWEAVEGENND